MIAFEWFDMVYFYDKYKKHKGAEKQQAALIVTNNEEFVKSPDKIIHISDGKIS